MIATPGPPAAVVETMAPDLAARVTAFARACKAAARHVALYPGEHPSVAEALEALTSAAEAATAQEGLHLSVMPDGLTVDGRPMARPDVAVAEFAGILHRHQVGQLSIRAGTDVDVWRRFLALLSLQPDQARLRGGLGKLWAAEGETLVELRIVDYNELLRSRLTGDRATWDAIVADCLEGRAFVPDDTTLDLLFGVLDDPAKISAVVKAIEAVLPEGHPPEQGPLIIAGLLQAVSRFVATSAPEQLDRVMTALAEAATRLSIETLGPIVDARRGGAGPGLAQFVKGLFRRMSDGSIARLLAAEVRGGRGSSQRLAAALHGLAPDADRRAAILTLARGALEESGGTADPAAAQAWQESEAMLLNYSDKAFVSDDYDTEFGRLTDRAVDLERDHTDPPAVVAAWCETVDEDDLRLLDAELISDLMRLESDVAHWRDLAGLALSRISALLVVGDFPAAALLVEALRSQAEDDEHPEIVTSAGEALQSVLTPATMRHVASHLDTVDPSVVHAAHRFCLAMGAAAIGPLADVLSREARNRPREHLIGILIAFGAAGRKSVEQLRHSPNAVVRRTAVLLLREFGGHEALPELASLLVDDEPHVQREATRAIAALRDDEAYDALIRALERGSERARATMLGALWTLPAEDAGPLLSYLVLTAPRHGAMWDVHARALERLGSLDAQFAVEPLAAVLLRRQSWAPFRMAALHRIAIDSLGRIGTPEARAVLETAASSGSRLARAAARARLSSMTSGAARQGPPV
jgi:hypothetical protein